MAGSAIQHFLEAHDRDRGFLTDLNAAFREAGTREERDAVWGAAQRFAAGNPDLLARVDAMREAVEPRPASRFHDANGNLIPLDHEILVEVREALAEAESDAERHEIVSAVIAGLFTTGDVDDGLVLAIQSEVTEFGAWGETEHDVIRDEPQSPGDAAIFEALMADADATDKDMRLPGSVREARGAAALLAEAMNSETGEAVMADTDA
jgi:hypothetical protein